MSIGGYVFIKGSIPPSFEVVYCYICGRRRVAIAQYRMAVAQYRMICLVPIYPGIVFAGYYYTQTENTCVS